MPNKPALFTPIHRVALVGFALLALSACASTGQSAAKPAGTAAPAEHWQTFEPNALKTSADTHAQIVLMREQDVIQGTAVNIFLDGEYFTSLLPGAYKQHVACVGIRRFTAHFTDVGTRYLEKQQQGQHFEIVPGQVNYYRVVRNAQGQPALASVQPHEGAAIASQLKAQSHTLVRVGKLQNCVAAKK